MLINNVQLGEG